MVAQEAQPQEAKQTQAGHTTNICDNIHSPLMLHLLVLLMLAGLWFKVHRLAQRWELFAAAGDHSFVKQESVSPSDTRCSLAPHEAATLGQDTLKQYGIQNPPRPLFGGQEQR